MKKRHRASKRRNFMRTNHHHPHHGTTPNESHLTKKKVSIGFDSTAGGSKTKENRRLQRGESGTVPMTFYECLGYGLMGFGPALCMFALTIARHPSRVVVLLVSSFGWLLSLLLSSLAWLALSPLGAPLSLGAAMAVFFQEAARLMTLRALRRVDRALNLAALAGAAQLARSRAGLAYASGLGFGVASGACSLLNVLADAAKTGAPPGLRGITDSVPDSFFLVSALTTNVLVLLHTLWSVISFQALWMRNRALLAFAPVAHVFASGLTLLYSRGDYGVPLAALVGVLLITAAMAFTVAGGRPGPVWTAFGLMPSPKGAEDEAAPAEG